MAEMWFVIHNTLHKLSAGSSLRNTAPASHRAVRWRCWLLALRCIISV